MILWSPKGGSGTSVLAAALALHLGRGRGPGPARLVDLGGDQPAVLGLAADPAPGIDDWLAAPDAPLEALGRLGVEVAPGLVLVPRGGAGSGATTPGGERVAEALLGGAVPAAPTVVDAASGDHPAVDALAGHATLVAVVRPCYLALRRAVGCELTRRSHGVVVIEEERRALTAPDVGRVLDLPVLARVPVVPRVARTVDAGLLVARVPDPLMRAVATLASRVPREPVAPASRECP